MKGLTAFRQLLQNPGFIAVAVLTLVLGIAANTAVFSRQCRAIACLPDSDRLLLLSNVRATDNMSIAYLDFKDWQQQNQVFTDLSALRNDARQGKAEPCAGSPRRRPQRRNIGGKTAAESSLARRHRRLLTK